MDRVTARTAPPSRRVGLVRVPPRVFDGIGVCAMVWLVAAASGLVPHRWAAGSAWPVTAAVVEQAALAERTMAEGARVLREAKIAEGTASDPGVDAESSGLVGAELTPLVTTLGSLEAKALASRPAWARVLALQLHHAGVGPGDVVAASFSGSFPGLNLAVSAAAEALGARVIAVSSVTASSWGASQPGFTWPEMEVRLVASRIIRPTTIAVSAGGADDLARDLEPDGRALALQIRDRVARELDVKVINTSRLEDTVRARLDAYQRAAANRRISAYVNVGGHLASLGESPAILRQRSGWLDRLPFDLSERRGVTARFVERGIPVLHLLNVRDLALRWGVL
jgi:poly-gamma-glutamate system protein